MFKHIAAVAIALMLGATAVTSATGERATTPEGLGSHDVMPVSGGGIEVHACRDGSVEGPYQIVEFGRSASGAASGVTLVVDAVQAGACAHLVIFTQPGPSQAL
jgi:hypothetical protein